MRRSIVPIRATGIKSVRWADNVVMARASAQVGPLHAVREFDPLEAPLTVADAPTVHSLSGLKRKAPFTEIAEASLTDENMVGAVAPSSPTSGMGARASRAAEAGRMPPGARMLPLSDSARKSPSPSPPHTPSVHRDTALTARVQRAEFDAAAAQMMHATLVLAPAGMGDGSDAAHELLSNPASGPVSTLSRKMYGRMSKRTAVTAPAARDAGSTSDLSRGENAVVAARQTLAEDVSRHPRRVTRSFVQKLIDASPAAMKTALPASISKDADPWRFLPSPSAAADATSPRSPLSGLSANRRDEADVRARDARSEDRKQHALKALSSFSAMDDADDSHEESDDEYDDAQSPSIGPASSAPGVVNSHGVENTEQPASLQVPSLGSFLLHSHVPGCASSPVSSTASAMDTDEKDDAKPVSRHEAEPVVAVPASDMMAVDDVVAAVSNGDAAHERETLSVTPPLPAHEAELADEVSAAPLIAPIITAPPSDIIKALAAASLSASGFTVIAEPQTPTPGPAALSGVTLSSLVPFAHPTPDGLLPSTPNHDKHGAKNTGETQVGPLWLLTRAGRDWAAARSRGEEGVPTSPQWRPQQPAAQIELSVYGIPADELGLGPRVQSPRKDHAGAEPISAKDPAVPVPPVPAPVPASITSIQPAVAPAAPTLVFLPPGFSVVPIGVGAAWLPSQVVSPPLAAPVAPLPETPAWFTRYEKLQAELRADAADKGGSSHVDVCAVAQSTTPPPQELDATSSPRDGFEITGFDDMGASPLHRNDADLDVDYTGECDAVAESEAPASEAPGGDGGREVADEGASAASDAHDIVLVIPNEVAQRKTLKSRPREVKLPSSDRIGHSDVEDDGRFSTISVPRDACPLLLIDERSSDLGSLDAATAAQTTAERASAAGPFSESAFLPFAFRLNAGAGSWAPPEEIRLTVSAAAREFARATKAGRNILCTAESAAATGYDGKMLPFYSDSAYGEVTELKTYAAALASAPLGSGSAYERAIAGLHL